MHQIHGGIVSDIVQPIGAITGGGIRFFAVPVGGRVRYFVNDPRDPFHNVVDVGEVPFHFAVVEDIDWPIFQDGLREQEQSHVRSAPWPVHGEKSKAGTGKTEKAAVTVGHKFIGFLACGIERNRMVYAVMDGKGHVGVCAVNGTGGGKYQVLYMSVPASFQDIEETHYVGVHVRIRVFERIPHPCLGRQVHDRIEARSGEEILHGRPIDHINVYMGEGGVGGQRVQACLFQVRVVVIVEIVEANNGASLIQEFSGKVETDESGGAGDQYLVGFIHVMRCLHNSNLSK